MNKKTILLLFILFISSTVYAADDGFEDGDYTNDPFWNDSYQNSGGSFSVQSTESLVGSYSLEVQSDGESDDSFARIKNTDLDPSNLTSGTNFSAVISTDNINKGDSSPSAQYALQGESGGNTYYTYIELKNKKANYGGDSSSVISFANGLINNTAYKVVITYDPNSVDYYVYNYSNNNLLGSAKNIDSSADYTSYDYVLFGVKDSLSTSYSSYIDDVTYDTSSDSGTSNSAPVLENPSPSNESTTVSVDQNLTVDYSDSDGDSGTVYFKWGNGTVIKKFSSVSSGSTLEVDLGTLKYDTKYYWKVNASDGSLSTTLDNLEFKTVQESKIIRSFDSTCLLGGYMNESSSPMVDYCGSNDGAWNGGISTGVDGAKNFNQDLAYDFTGTDSYLDIGDPGFMEQESFTFATWVNYGSGTKPAAGSAEYLIAPSYDGTNHPYHVAYDNSKYTNSEQVVLRSYDGTNAAVVGAGAALPDNGWSLVTVTYNASSDTAKFYYNGSLKNSGSISQSISTTGSYYVGAFDNSGTPSKFFDGYMDEIRVYEDVKTQSEVQTIYKDSKLGPEKNDLTLDLPDNTTYTTDNVSLKGTTNFDANISYILDSGSKVSICDNCSSFDLSLTDLSEGGHDVKVEAVKYQDSSINKSSTVHFTVNLEPLWRNLQQSKGSVSYLESNFLKAQGKDSQGLQRAFLSTNESGSSTNYTGQFLGRNGNDYFTSNAFESIAVYDQQGPALWYIDQQISTYFVYQGENGNNPQIGLYNHSKDVFEGAFEVATNDLTGDSHGAPSFWINQTDGEICVFYGSHSTDQPYSCNGGGFNISGSTWTEYTSFPGTDNTYPEPRVFNGTLYIILRTSTENPTEWSFTSTSDPSGGTWSSFDKLIHSDGDRDWYIHPTKKVVEGNNVVQGPHLPFASSRSGSDVFAGYFNLTDGHVYNITGYDIGEVMNDSLAESHAKVLETGPELSTNVYKGERYRIMRYSKDNYYVIFPRNASQPENERLQVAHFNSSTDGWEIFNTSMNEYPHTGLTYFDYRVENGSELTAYVPRYDSSDVGGKVLEKWSSSNYGRNWSLDTTVINSTKVGSDPIDMPHIPVNFDDEFRVQFQDRLRTDHDTDGKMWFWGNEHGIKSYYDSTDWTWSNFTWSNNDVSGAGVSWNIWYENTDGGYNRTDSLFFSVGSESGSEPSVSIRYPGNSTYGSSSLDLNVTSGKNGLDWTYSLDGAANQTFTPNTTISELSDGSHTVEVYGNDSNGNIGAASTTFTVDTTAPTATIHSPSNTTYQDQSTINLDVTGSDATSGISTWYYNKDGGGENSFTPNTSLTFTDGHHTVSVKASDSVVNNVTKEIDLTVNLTLPDGYVETIPAGKAVGLRSNPGTDMNQYSNNKQGVQDLVFGNGQGTELAAQLRANLSAGNVTGQHLQFDSNRSKKAAYIHNTSSVSNLKQKTLLVPRVLGSGKIHICPDAENFSATELGCSNGYNISKGETVNGVSLSTATINGDSYYEATGISGTGGVELSDSTDSPIGGGGGGSSGGSDSKVTALFDSMTLSVPEEEGVKRSIVVENNGTGVEDVTVDVPLSNGCTVFEVETGYKTGEYSSSGSYSLEPGVRKEVGVRVDGSGFEDRVECGLDAVTGSGNGVAGAELVAERSTGFVQVVKDVTGVDLAPLFEEESLFDYCTEGLSCGDSKKNEVSVSPFEGLVGVILVLAVVGVANSRFN